MYRTLLVVLLCGIAGVIVYAFNGTQELTRDRAAEIIRQALTQNNETTLKRQLPLSSVGTAFQFQPRTASDDVSGVIPKLDELTRISDQEYTQLKSMAAKSNETAVLSQYGVLPFSRMMDDLRAIWASGLIKEFKWKPERHPVVTVYNIRATGVVADEIRGFCQATYKAGDECEYDAATVSLVIVTGIFGSEAIRRVEYDVRIEPTQFGKRVAALWPNHTYRSEIRHNVLNFIRYDDGWRIAR